MLLNHVGIVNTSEEGALLFYRDFLGLEKTREFSVSPELAAQLFSFSREVKVLVFEKEAVKFEVFIYPHYRKPHPDFSHACCMLDDLTGVMEMAPKAGVELITGQHGEKTVYFIKDFSGNLIEIKQK